MTRRRTTLEKREAKQAQLIERTARIWNIDDKIARQFLTSNLVQSVRINPLAGAPGTTLVAMQQLGWRGKPYAWCLDTYSIDEGYSELRDSELPKEGRIYIQNEASLVPVTVLDPRPHETILDMCAAPGGKTAHIAARMEGSGRLVANDNSRARLMRLQANLGRLNVKAEYMLFDARRLSQKTSDTFDRILLDAPCSGEGLINLDRPATLDTWSVAHIRRLAELQKRLIREAWQILKPGGRLVYSTCTMAPEENEMVIDWLLRREPDARTFPIVLPGLTASPALPVWNGREMHPGVSGARRLKPEKGREAFFVCALEKQVG